MQLMTSVLMCFQCPSMCGEDLCMSVVTSIRPQDDVCDAGAASSCMESDGSQGQSMYVLTCRSPIIALTTRICDMVV